MVVKRKRIVKVGPLTALNDSIKATFKSEMASAKGDPPKGGPYRDGDRIMYRGEPWYVDGKDNGGSFVAIRDSNKEKHFSQKVPRATLFPINTQDAGNGPPMTKAEKKYKEFQEAQTERRQLFSDKELTQPPARKGRGNGEARPPREVKPKDPNAIPLKKICAEVNVDPKLARRLLRAETSIPRPEGRWEFNPKDVERIKKVITQPV